MESKDEDGKENERNRISETDTAISSLIVRELAHWYTRHENVTILRRTSMSSIFLLLALLHAYGCV